MKKFHVLALTFIMSVSLFPVSADMISIDDVLTRRIQDSGQNGTGDSVQNNQMWAGPIAGSDWATVVAFQMTGLSDPTQIDLADFSIVKNSTAGDASLALDVIRTSNDSTINANDYELAINVSEQRLSNDFADGPDSESYSLDGTGQTRLTSYLQDNWVENEYVFVRLRSATIGPATGGAYQFGGNSDAVVAQLTITAIPEASTAGLLGMGIAVVLLRRRFQGC